MSGLQDELMSSTVILYAEFYACVATFSVAAWLYYRPWAREVDFADAVTPILLLHSLRHAGMVYLLPQVVPELPPESFAAATAWGDVATAALAFLALGLVRFETRLALPAVALFNVVGFADLGLAALNAQKAGLMDYAIGPAYVLPAFVVPALVVSHVAVFWRMRLELRSAPAASH